MNTRIRGLYLITGPSPPPADRHASLCAAVEQAIAGGANIVQYRDKSPDTSRRADEASALLRICRQHDVPLIINDDVTLAATIAADGVHLGRHDMTLCQARELLGRQAIIGVSCYNRLTMAIQAQDEGANYVAFGSFFPSPTKPRALRADKALLQQARNRLNIPIVAIGGISADNGAGLLAAGADALAVISGVFAQTDIRSAARNYARLFEYRGKSKEQRAKYGFRL